MNIPNNILYVFKLKGTDLDKNLASFLSLLQFHL